MASSENNDSLGEPGSMEEALGAWLVSIDEVLSTSHVPVPTRPLEAARVFIERALVAVNGEVIEPSHFDEHLTSPWFKKLYGAVHAWYVQRYGPALTQPESYLSGVALIFGAPFELRVPVTSSKVETPGETTWLTFPAGVQDDEDPRTWLQSAPNLVSLGTLESEELTSQLRTLGTHLRTIRLDVTCATKPDHVSQALADKVLSHLDAAANHLLRREHGNYGLAAWDSHQAAESAVKLLCRQARGAHLPIHDLLTLLDDLEPAVQLRIDRSLVASIPSGKRIVELRAGEGTSLTFGEVYEIYRCSLAVAHQASGCLSYKVRTHNASFLIRKAPWIVGQLGPGPDEET